eukprot:866324-Pleurochrysis_carterae.AAC.1
MRMDVALAGCSEGLVEMDSRSLTVAAKDPASLASFKKAVVVELVGENPLGPADERVLWTLNQFKGIVWYLALDIALELLNASCAPFFFVKAA